MNVIPVWTLASLVTVIGGFSPIVVIPTTGRQVGFWSVECQMSCTSARFSNECRQTSAVPVRYTGCSARARDTDVLRESA